MGKRIYRAVSVKKVDVEKLARAEGGRLVLGCDAAKELWYGAWMNERGEVLQTMRWDMVHDCEALLERIEQLREAGLTVEVAVEPTGTYADALVEQLRQRDLAVYRVSAKHAHDYQEIYDGVPSGHDAKSAAIVAKLHLDSKSRRWKRMDDARRQLRVAADDLDWVKDDEKRYRSRLESRLARHWPELLRLMDLTTKTPLELLARYGGPAEVTANGQAAEGLMQCCSKGLMDADKIANVVQSAGRSIGVVMVAAEDEQIKQLASKLLKLRQQRRELERQLEQRVDAQPQLAGISEMVGKGTAGVLYARLGDLRDYGSVRALWRGPGMNLKEHSSGKKKGQLTLTKRGSSVARRWLHLATLRWIRTDIVAGAWYARKVAQNGGIKLKAVIALTRKLLTALFHIARGASYDPEKLFDTRRLKFPELVTATR